MAIGPTSNSQVPPAMLDTGTSRPNIPVAQSQPQQIGATGSQPPAAQPPVVQQPTLDEVQAAAQQIQDYLVSSARTLDYRVDGSTGMTVVTVTDTETGDVIRQIPSEEVLKLAQMLDKSPASNASASALLNLTA
jgi:flagellar protein FlaG